MEVNIVNKIPELMEIAKIYNLSYTIYECSYPIDSMNHMIQYRTSDVAGDSRWITLNLIIDGDMFKVQDYNSLEFPVWCIGNKLLQWIKLMGIPESCSGKIEGE
jgi:hypothetical protein